MLDLALALLKFHQSGQLIPTENPFEWLNAFDAEDLNDLLEEVSTGFHRARQGEVSWNEFDSILHEWQKSAWAARSTELAEAFAAPASECPLIEPSEIADVETNGG